MKLFKLEGGRYRFQTEGISIEGKFEFVLNAMVDYGVDPVEVDFAMKDMAEKGNDIALFGISFTFLYSRLNRTERNLALEFSAIESVRTEFKILAKKDPHSMAAKEAFNRLINLYMSVNVPGVLHYLDRAVS